MLINNQKLIDHVKNLVSKGRTSQAVDYLLKHSPTESIKNQVQLIRASLFNLKREEAAGITDSKVTIEKINSRIFIVADAIDNRIDIKLESSTLTQIQQETVLNHAGKETIIDVNKIGKVKLLVTTKDSMSFILGIICSTVIMTIIFSNISYEFQLMKCELDQLKKNNHSITANTTETVGSANITVSDIKKKRKSSPPLNSTEIDDDSTDESMAVVEECLCDSLKIELDKVKNQLMKQHSK